MLIALQFSLFCIHTDDWINDYRILSVFIATAVLATCGISVICTGFTCRYCKRKQKKSSKQQFQNTIVLSDVIYEDLSREKRNVDEQGVVTIPNVAYVTRSDMTNSKAEANSLYIDNHQ